MGFSLVRSDQNAIFLRCGQRPWIWRDGSRAGTAPRARIIAFALGLAALALTLSAAARATHAAAVVSDPWIVYVYDESGNYLGRQTADHPLADGSRWACRRGGSCRPCEACHTTTQLGDRTDMVTYEGKRHTTTHYPRLAVSLSSGQSFGWGRVATLRRRDTSLVITNGTGSKDVMIFPPGSHALRDLQGAARLVLLPPNLAPRLP